MVRKSKKRRNVVYSTNPDYDFTSNEEDQGTLLPGDQYLKIMVDRKQRKGKEVTLIKGFAGTEEDLKGLAKILKQKCGVGGSAKEGEIIVQGNQITKIIEYLETEGYNVKKSGS